MAANPITFQEIEAYCRLSLVVMTPWEVSTLRRMDDAMLGVVSKRSPANRKPGAEPEAEPVSVKDGTGMKALFRRMARKKEAEGKA